MATIRKRGKRYQVQVRKAGHDPINRSFPTKAEASRWAKAQEVTIEKGGIVDTSGRTLSDAIKRWRDEQNLNTYQSGVLDWWDAELGYKKLSALRKADFAEARRRLQKLPKAKGEGAIAPATVNRRMAAISRILTECIREWYYLEVNPAQIGSLEEEIPNVEPLTEKQRERLLKACAEADQPALLPFVLCAMASGARAGELQGLRWRDIDLQKGVARLYDTKNRDNRVVPIQGRALQALKLYQRDHPHIGKDFVFRNRTGTFPFHYRKTWGEAKAFAGLDIRFHDLRHDAASNLAMAGASLGEIGEVLGHRSAQMAKRYSHFVADHIAELGKRITDRIDT
jgi:integrase